MDTLRQQAVANLAIKEKAFNLKSNAVTKFHQKINSSGKIGIKNEIENIKLLSPSVRTWKDANKIRYGQISERKGLLSNFNVETNPTQELREDRKRKRNDEIIESTSNTAIVRDPRKGDKIALGRLYLQSCLY